MAEQVRVWDRLHRHGAGPSVLAYPADTPRSALPVGRVIDKRHVRIVLSWPTTESAASNDVDRTPPSDEGE
jgi:protein-L-isoaspartate(D-aspartate) O-methyltransferase